MQKKTHMTKVAKQISNISNYTELKFSGFTVVV